jgi:gluconolactonase
MGIEQLVEEGARLEVIAGGFEFTEGPAWNPAEGRLYFSDVIGDTRWRWSDRDGLERVASSTHKSNGSAFAPDLSQVVCEHNTSQVVRWTSSDRREILAAEHVGVGLNSPNDVCVRSDGRIYFTDPYFGREEPAGLERAPELDFQGVFTISPSGELALVRDDFAGPNGICFSPAEDVLYVNDSPRAEVRGFEIESDGSLGDEWVVAEEIGDGKFEHGIVDGMKCDIDGNVWVTGPGGIWVFTESGTRIGVLSVPEPNVGNLAWGGADWRDLYICGTSKLYRIRTAVAGAHLAFEGAFR